MHGPRPFSCRRRPQIRHHQSAAQPQPHHLFRPSKTTVAKRILVDGPLRRRHRPLALISLHTPTVTIESPARDTPPRPRARQPSSDLLRPPLVAGAISHRDFCLQFFSLPCPPLALTHRNIAPRRSSSPTITRHFTPPSVCPDRDDISPPHARLDDIDDKGGNMGNQGDRQPPRYRLTGRLPIQSGRFRHTCDSQSPPRARCSAPASDIPRAAVRHPISHISDKTGKTRRGRYGYLGCKWSLDPATADPFGLSYLLEMLCLPPWDTEERDWVEWASERAIGLSVTDEVGLIGLRSIAASLFISDTDFWMETGSTGSRSQHRYRLGSSPAVTSPCLVFFFDPTAALAGSCRRLIVWPFFLPSCARALPRFAHDSLLGVSGERCVLAGSMQKYLRISMGCSISFPDTTPLVDLRCLAAPWAVIGHPL